MTGTYYSPKDIFAKGGGPLPRALVAPQRYIQGPGVINHIGHYLSLLKVRRVGVLASRRGLGSQGLQVADSLQAAHMIAINSQFNGECTNDEIELHVTLLSDQKIDCLIALGGGKVVDAGKSIAFRLDIPVVIIPTLASNDAPCSALSVIYMANGKKDRVEYFPQNPAFVVVDTDIVANAGERYLVAGMGDAMATWYEAKVCYNNPSASNCLGARPTLAACAIGEVCAKTLYAHGEAAAESVRQKQNGDAVEAIVEANTLLSGIGFESGGLALAHPLALAYTLIPVVNDNYLHGEMVAMGTLAQLVLDDSEDALRVAQFFARVGLPIHLGQLSLSAQHGEALDTLIEATLANPISHHMPLSVNHDSLRDAIIRAHDLGLGVSRTIGDDAYRRLQG